MEGRIFSTSSQSPLRTSGLVTRSNRWCRFISRSMKWEFLSHCPGLCESGPDERDHGQNKHSLLDSQRRSQQCVWGGGGRSPEFAHFQKHKDKVKSPGPGRTGSGSRLGGALNGRVRLRRRPSYFDEWPIDHPAQPSVLSLPVFTDVRKL